MFNMSVAVDANCVKAMVAEFKMEKFMEEVK